MQSTASGWTAATREVVDTANPVYALLSDPRFRTLLRKRRGFAWTLTAVMLSVYFGFILTLAFDPTLLATPLVSGAPATWGIAAGFGMFAFTFMMVAVYVVRANTSFDRAVAEIRAGEQS
jgi:uncharacterized membrane protein (DUF485 family)